MIEILDPRDDIDRGGKANVSLDLLIKKQLAQVNKSIDYYRKTPVYVNASHPLRRIIFDMDNGEESLFNLFNRIRDEIPTLCIMHGIVYETYNGELNYSDYPYKKGTALMSVEKLTLSDALSKRWEELKPVEMVYKPYVSNSLELPHSSSTEVDCMCLMTIDLTCLAVKYHKWALVNNEKTSDQRQDVSDFVSREVLAPLIMDSARLSYIEMFNTFDLGKVNNKVPFAVVDNTPKLHSEIRKISSDYTSEGRHHSNMLKEIPCFDKESFYDAFANLSDERITTHNRWFKFLSESQYITAILNTVRNDNDKDVRLRFNFQTRILKGNRTLRSSPSKEVNTLMSERYELIDSLINS